MIYETDKDFRKAMEDKLGEPFTDTAWEALSELLWQTGIHCFLTDEDVEDAMFYLGELRKVFEELKKGV